MLPLYIGMFAKEYLKNKETISPVELQKFIFSRPEVGKNLPLNDISVVLEEMYENGDLEIVLANKDTIIYKAY